MGGRNQAMTALAAGLEAFTGARRDKRERDKEDAARAFYEKMMTDRAEQDRREMELTEQRAVRQTLLHEQNLKNAKYLADRRELEDKRKDEQRKEMMGLVRERTGREMSPEAATWALDYKRAQQTLDNLLLEHKVQQKNFDFNADVDAAIEATTGMPHAEWKAKITIETKEHERSAARYLDLDRELGYHQRKEFQDLLQETMGVSSIPAAEAIEKYPEALVGEQQPGLAPLPGLDPNAPTTRAKFAQRVQDDQEVAQLEHSLQYMLDNLGTKMQSADDLGMTIEYGPEAKLAINEVRRKLIARTLQLNHIKMSPELERHLTEQWSIDGVPKPEQKEKLGAIRLQVKEAQKTWQAFRQADQAYAKAKKENEQGALSPRTWSAIEQEYQQTRGDWTGFLLETTQMASKWLVPSASEIGSLAGMYTGQKMGQKADELFREQRAAHMPPPGTRPTPPTAPTLGTSAAAALRAPPNKPKRASLPGFP